MSRSTLRVLSAMLAVSAAACASPTNPTSSDTHSLSVPGASFDDITPPPTDSTCRSGYIVTQGRTC